MADISFLQVLWLLLWVLVFAVSGFALWKGGQPERIGGALVLGIALISWLIDVLLPSGARAVGHLSNDAALAIGFLAVAVRYASLWLGGAMMFQAAQFSLHAYYFLTERKPDLFHYIVNNLDVLGVLACLAAGTVATQRIAHAQAQAQQAGQS